MDYSLRDLLDIPKLQAVLDTLDEIHILPSAIIDTRGSILTATSWQDICTKFHRANPETEKRCRESDIHIAAELDRSRPHVVNKCPLGLIDAATPIIVEDRHLGNVFTGQLFTEAPDQERFIRQARQYGFDEREYLDALAKVPIISEQRLVKNLEFLSRFAEMLAAQGLTHLRQLETEKALRESQTIFQSFLEHSPVYVFFKDRDMRSLQLSRNYETMLNRPLDELLGKSMDELFPSPLAKSMVEDDKKIMAMGKALDIEEELNGRFYHTMKFPIAIEGEPRYLAGYTIDITERRKTEDALKLNEDRLETLLKLTMMKFGSDKEVTDFALEEGVRLTRSRGGYLHFFNEDARTIQLYSWSKDVLRICTAAKNEHYPLDKAGVWADSVRLRRPVIHNDYQELSEKKGYPDGHFHLVRHLGVPIFDEEKIVGVTGVGNKEEPYDEIDAVQINLFMNSMWRILKQKRNEEEREKLILELRESLARVRTLSRLLPICSSCKKIRDDKGYWKQIESYISEHSDTSFTHGICPDCADRLYPGIFEGGNNDIHSL